jgi:hypothetical protein
MIMKSDWRKQVADSQAKAKVLSETNYPYRVKEGSWLAGVCKGWEDMGRGRAWKYRLLFAILTVYGAPVYAYFALARPLKSNLFGAAGEVRYSIQAIKSRKRRATLIAVAAALSPIAAASILVAYLAPIGDTAADIGGMRAPKVGETQYIGQGNCDRAVKGLLRDPASFERIATQIVDVKAGEGWVAQVDFRARNGFAGYDTGSAFCVFNGSSYRALLDE